MKKVIIEQEKTDVILLSDVNTSWPIFAKLHGKLVGMVVYESGRGWILKIGGDREVNGLKDILKDLIKTGIERGYEFYVED